MWHCAGQLPVPHGIPLQGDDNDNDNDDANDNDNDNDDDNDSDSVCIPDQHHLGEN